MNPLLILAAAAGGLYVLSKKDKKKKLTPTKPPRPVAGLEVIDDGTCSVRVVDDGPLLALSEQLSLANYGTPDPPVEAVEEHLAAVFAGVLPQCQWPPGEDWYIEEEGERGNWAALVGHWINNARELGRAPEGIFR